MKEEFFAELVTCEKGDESLTIGFSDNGDAPDSYVILEKALEFDKQDIDLGMDTYYLEYNGISDYGVCEKVILKKTSILFSLKDYFIDDVSEIMISFSENSITDKKEFVETLRNIFGNILELDLRIIIE
jgi:hypothetical protein